MTQAPFDRAILETPLPPSVPADLARELWRERARREQLEKELVAALTAASQHQAAFEGSQRQLFGITDPLPVLVSYIDAQCRYRFVNQTYERWFGVARDTIVGRTMSDVLGAEAYERVSDLVAQALAGRRVNVQRRVPYRYGGGRYVDITYIPHLNAGGGVRGFVCLIWDITDSKRAEQARELSAFRSERLMRVTAAIADAVEPEQVLEAVVDRVRELLGASSVGLWLASEAGERLELVRAAGMPAQVPAQIPARAAAPLMAALQGRAPLWVSSRAELNRLPELALAFSSLFSPAGSGCLAWLPLGARGITRAALCLSFSDERINDALERDLLSLVARYAGQAIERSNLLATERALRTQSEALREANEQGLVRAELLYGLAAEVIHAKTVEDVFDAALDGIERALGASRCSILTFDADGVMRFKAWRGLSDHYRADVEGHSPWQRDATNPQPIFVPDVLADESLSSYAELFQSESIGALGFIPLVSEGRLIGKFMVYYPLPRVLSAAEVDMSKAIANHVAAAIGRFSALRELEQTVRFNEIFTGMLGHDLRNPLGAIMASAQMAVRRSEQGHLEKPLGRIIKSGERMATMIDQLLDFTRVRVGAGIPIDPRACDLFVIMGQAVDELSHAHPSWRFSLQRGPGDTAGVWDADRLLQVFSNLVSNAVQHGSADHAVSVLFDGSSPDAVSVRIHNMGDIPVELLPRLFEPMAGGDRRRTNSRGLGLGLYISREIVRAHGAELIVTTSAADGTSFMLRLPRVALGAEGPRA